MSNNEGEKLRLYVRLSNKKEDEIASLIGINRATLYDWYKKTTFTNVQLGKLERAGINLESNQQITESHINNDLSIPVYDVEVTAGNVSFADLGNGAVLGHISIPQYKGLDGFVKVSGDSMESKFCSGDYVGFKKIDDLDFIQYGQTYIIESADNQRMLKVIKKGTKEGYITIHSLNDKYEDFEVPLKKIKAIYIVLAKISGF